MANLFSKQVNDAAQAIADAERDRLLSQPVSELQRVTQSIRCIPHGGQSFDAGSDNSRCYLTPAKMAALGLKMNAATISRDGRTVGDGNVFQTWDGNDRKLYQLQDRMVFGTGVDRIATQAEYDRGDYPQNARGMWCGVARSLVRQTLRRMHLGLTAVEPILDIPFSWSKTGGLAEIVFGPPGLDRFNNALEIVRQVAASPVAGGSGFTIPATRNVRIEAMAITHGQTDNRANVGPIVDAGTQDYKQQLSVFYKHARNAAQAQFGQTRPFAMMVNQVGGPDYGTIPMKTSQDQSDMADDITGDWKWFFLGSSQCEMPTFVNVIAPHPGAGDPHPSLAGTLILGVRHGVLEYYLLDLQKPYFIPKCMDGFYDGKKFLIPICSMFGALHAAPMPYGVTPINHTHRNFAFGNASDVVSNDALAHIEFIRPVEGNYTLLEGQTTEDMSGFIYGHCGRRDVPNGYTGCPEFRDGFELPMAFDLPFELPNQRQYANAAWVSGTVGNGYVDNPGTNGFGRYIEDIPGWVGAYDWGNPLRLNHFTMAPAPVAFPVYGHADIVAADDTMTALGTAATITTTAVARQITVDYEDRIVTPLEGIMGALMWPSPKDPDEVLDFGINWPNRVGVDRIVSSLWELPVGLGFTKAEFTNTSTSIWLTGGVLGSIYELTNRITTEAGRVMDQTGHLRIEAK